jgi:hypothetical protein
MWLAMRGLIVWSRGANVHTFGGPRVLPAISDPDFATRLRMA